MNTLYKPNTANYPRLATDKYWADYGMQMRVTGFLKETLEFVEQNQLLREDLWTRFVHQYKEADADHEGGWRGEYWGKMMRGACFVYSCTGNPKLYDVLENTVKDMLTAAEENGRISTYAVNHEFEAWDIWCRKYVMLGMQYFLEICKDDALAVKITASMCGQADYMISKLGLESEGKKLITKATKNWGGLNSSSLLEPIVRLYAITGKQEYLDFATYIVDCGGTSVENVFELAYADELYPYQYPYTKAYEMTSCFEGILEYYRVTGVEKYKDMVVRFADKVLESDYTIIGSSGCTHELFDHSTVRQANTDNHDVGQETCVTVTLMKFFYQLTLLTGDSKYVDAFEQSLYNGYLGAVNTEHMIEKSIYEKYADCVKEAVPFDSYSPLVAGRRGKSMGGIKVMSDNHYYGCCACIGSAGIGLISKMTLLTAKDGFAWNLFVNGELISKTPSGNEVVFKIETDYPVSGKVQMTVEPAQPEQFVLRIRKPVWSKEMPVVVTASATENVDAGYKAQSEENGYILLNRVWNKGDVVTVEPDMRTEAIKPIPYGQDNLRTRTDWENNCMFTDLNIEDPMAQNHLALRRGPIILAQENRLGYSVDDPVSIAVEADGYVKTTFPEKDIAPYKHILELEVPLTDGSKMHVTDYASAGKLWSDESKMAAWILTK